MFADMNNYINKYIKKKHGQCLVKKNMTCQLI